MLFVPLPLFATLLLCLLALRFALTRDLSRPAHQVFLALVILYAGQSLLFSLRWGYGVSAAAAGAAVLAPVLPVLATLAYAALSGPLRGVRLLPILAIAVNWLAWALWPQATDALILLTYLGFGGVLLHRAWLGPDRLALSPLGKVQGIVQAMALTGAALVASGLTDIYVIVDFIRHEGRNVGLVVTLMQTGFVLAIGGAAALGRTSDKDNEPEPATLPPAATDEDGDILRQLEALFASEGLHKTEDLSLRRLARRLHLPDRRVSNAINRVRGQSVSQFVNDYRIKEACALLETSDDTVLAISLAAGFATKSNFNREFLRVTGTTPAKWRKDRGAPAQG